MKDQNNEDIPKPSGNGLTKEEKEIVMERLRKLGYL